jgi:hypothetical protein
LVVAPFEPSAASPAAPLRRGHLYTGLVLTRIKVPARPGPASACRDGELLAIAVVWHMPGRRSEAGFLAAAAGLADPIASWTRSGASCCAGSGSAVAEPERSDARPLGGIVLQLQADLRWLEACERNWTGWAARA